MSSMYNKLCNEQNHGLIFLVSHICIKDKDHQMSFKRYANQIWSHQVMLVL